MIRDLLELKKRYLFGNDIERHVGKYTCISEPTNGYEEINEPVVPVKLKEKDKRKIARAIEIYEKIEAKKAETRQRQIDKKLVNRKNKPVMCVETGQVFESISEAYLWHVETTGMRSDISSKCKTGRATKTGYHFRYVQS